MIPIYKRVMLKLSGEVLEGEQGQGIDFNIVSNLCQEIAEIQKNGLEIAIVIGGGNIWRFRDFQNSCIDRVSSDYMGMMATIMNAVALEKTFLDQGTPAQVFSSFPIPQIAPQYNHNQAKETLKNKKIVICAGGTGNPFFTTDSAAALRALELECEVLLKATKVQGVYDKDPVKNPDAKFYPEISFDEVLNQNLNVMDLAAVSLCREKPLPITVFDLTQKGNIAKIISGEKIGSTIK